MRDLFDGSSFHHFVLFHLLVLIDVVGVVVAGVPDLLTLLDDFRHFGDLRLLLHNVISVDVFLLLLDGLFLDGAEFLSLFGQLPQELHDVLIISLLGRGGCRSLAGVLVPAENQLSVLVPFNAANDAIGTPVVGAFGDAAVGVVQDHHRATDERRGSLRNVNLDSFGLLLLLEEFPETSLSRRNDGEEDEKKCEFIPLFHPRSGRIRMTNALKVAAEEEFICLL